MTVRHDNLTVSWLGYATVRLETESGFVAYLDPGRYGVLTGEWTPPGDEPVDHPAPVDYHARDGDLVCVTHDHHYDPDGIRRVAKPDATVVAYEAVDADNVDRDVEPVEALPHDVIRVDDEAHLTASRPGDESAGDGDGQGLAVTVHGGSFDPAADGTTGSDGTGDGEGGVADVWTLPAYNEPDGPRAGPDGSVSHPQGFGCAYLLSLDGTSVFWPGDSDALPGFELLEPSLFLANIAGTVVMDRHEAADLAEAMDPDLVVPVHYDTIDILRTDSGAFATDVARRSIPVALDER
jgi:L-ascorbate metabolism protein UlaG (beta-lactamase superfamily)